MYINKIRCTHEMYTTNEKNKKEKKQKERI